MTDCLEKMRRSPSALSNPLLELSSMIRWPPYENFPSHLRESMPINIFEEQGSIVVEAAIPGVRADQVELSRTGNVLTIRARVDVPERAYLVQELQSVEHRRQIVLPGDCRFEESSADVEDGMLTVRVPKTSPQRSERIRIQVTRRGPAAHTIEAEPKGTRSSTTRRKSQ
jgi:HSP20 family protein